MGEHKNYKNFLQRSNSKIVAKDILAFDIETYNNNKNFLLGDVYNGISHHTFYNRDDMKKYFANSKLYNTYITATNLHFDFTMLYDIKDMAKFDIIQNNGNFISCKYKFAHTKNANVFIDSMNFMKISVEKAGKLLGLEKIDKPKFLGQKPKTQEEWDELIKYNQRDTEITYKLMRLLQNGFNMLGGNMKTTISSTALDIYKHKYLPTILIKEDYILQQSLKHKILKAYYGGRTEVFKRGKIENGCKLYDVNCFSKDTEILTLKGFKKYYEITMKDIVYGMKNDVLEQQKINKIIINKYDGKMLLFDNENTSQFITPNHRILYKEYSRNKKSKDYKRWSEWKFKEAKNFPKTNYIKFPNAKIYDGKYFIPENILKLCAWYITEGSINKYGIIEITQSYSVNKEKCFDILNIMESLKIDYRKRYYKRKDDGKTYLIIHFNMNVIEKYFNNIMDKNSYNMRLINNFQELSYMQKKIFFEELMKGDGCYQKGKTTYISYSDMLLDDMQILSTMIGYKCSINYKYHVCHIKMNRGGDSHFGNSQIKKVLYNDIVWCVNTPLDNVVMRRNGKVFISKNSLYPFVMCNDYPLPQSAKVVHAVNNNVLEYEGVSDVSVESPYMHIPLLPFKDKVLNKLIFPVGKWRSSYSHVELRKFLSLGGKILKYHHTIIYERTFTPFKEYVEEIYKKRQDYQLEGNPLQAVMKLCLNSLYGKFGQKDYNELEFFSFDEMTDSEMDKYMNSSNTETFGEAGYYTHKKECNSNFVFPILPVYTTAYARLELYKYLTKYDAYYSDTDSIISRYEIPTSNKLGGMKLEYKINHGIIIRPKMYMLNTSDGDVVKMKGVQSAGLKEFRKALGGEKIQYNKFLKIKESIKRNVHVNMVDTMTKLIDLDDDKRLWMKRFNPNILDSDSRPYNINETLPRMKRIVHRLSYKEKLLKANNYYEKIKSQRIKNFIDSDLFDKRSVGKDVTPEYFISEEMSNARL